MKRTWRRGDNAQTPEKETRMVARREITVTLLGLKRHATATTSGSVSLGSVDSWIMANASAKRVGRSTCPVPRRVLY